MAAVSATQATPRSGMNRPGHRTLVGSHSRIPLVIAAVIGLAGAVALVVGPASGTDLAAQQARAVFAWSHPWSAVDLRWFGGIQPAAYSVLSPYVMAGLGVRVTGALAALAASLLFPLLLRRWGARRAGWATAWAAVAFVLDVVDGRVTFALGLAVGLAALVVVPREAARRWRWAGAVSLAAACSLTSPVAGVFLALVALGWALRRRSVVVLTVAALVPLGVIHLLFPEPGRMPYSWSTARPDLFAALAVVVLCRGRAVRAVALVYGIAVLVDYWHPGPVGSNAERLALLFTGPVLICCWRAPRILLLAALAIVGYWTTSVPIRDLHNAHGLAVEQAAARRLVGDLAGLGPLTGRIEVVPFRDHGEAQIVAQRWPLARGWERQLDTVYAAALYDGPLTAARYLSWLRANAVQYVALGRHAHDFGALHELALLQDPPSYLVPVHTDSEWTVWRVVDSTPLVSPPGRLVAQTPASVTLSVPARVPVHVAVRWAGWWHASGGARVVRDGDWVAVTAPRTETVTLSAPY